MLASWLLVGAGVTFSGTLLYSQFREQRVSPAVAEATSNSSDALGTAALVDAEQAGPSSTVAETSPAVGVTATRTWPRTVDTAATARYLARLDLQKYIVVGSSYTDPTFSPLRLGKPLRELDQTYDYDFERLARVEEMLWGVDRKQVLHEIFNRICTHCRNNTERHLAVLEFCNKASFHNRIQPMWPDKSCVYDPLILLELGEKRCGQVNRLAIDLFAAAGYEGRVVAVGHHLLAEIYYDGDWHYFDAGLFGGRFSVVDEDGTIPSMAELSQSPYRIDALPSVEPTFLNAPKVKSWDAYPSYYYFSIRSYTRPPSFYVKTADAGQEQATRTYGWNFFKTVPGDWKPHNLQRKYIPGAPRRVHVKDGEITWSPSEDRDDDLCGYRVYVSSQPRGWCYGPDWRPDMYDARCQEPPCDIAKLTTTACSVPVPETTIRPLYVTVMPFDEHGESVGRRIYPASRQLVIPDE